MNVVVLAIDARLYIERKSREKGWAVAVFILGLAPGSRTNADVEVYGSSIISILVKGIYLNMIYLILIYYVYQRNPTSLYADLRYKDSFIQ